MSLLALAAFLTSPCCTLSVSVRDRDNRPIPAATVRTAGAALETGANGSVRFDLPAPGRYTVEAAARGFQTMRKEVDAAPGAAAVELLLLPAQVESVTVEGRIASDGSAAALSPVAAEQLKRLPTDPPTVRDALPLIPGVLRTPEGRLRISGAPEYRSTLLVNSLDATDPATGSFGATVPLDSVASLNVFRSPFLAEYGRFTAAVVVVDTKRGGEKWRAELNDPTPELRIRSRRLRGVRGFTPRLGFSGPLVGQKLYFSQSGEYRLNKTPVFTQPFPENETWREGWNSLVQLDYLPSATRSTTATVHLVPQKVKHAQLSFYTPRPATPDIRSREFQASVTDRAALGAGVLETALSAREATLRASGRSGGEYTLAPATTLGSWFAAQERRGRRYQWRQAYTLARGAHHLSLGSGLIRSTLGGQFRARPVAISNFDGAPLGRIEFHNGPAYSLHDWENGTYVQDQWQLRPNLAIDFGARADWQQVTSTVRLAPRMGVSWAPFEDSATVLRGGAGWFFDRAPLSIYAFPAYPRQEIGGVLFENALGSRDGAGPLVFGAAREGNFAPRTRTFGAQVEHRFARFFRLKAAWFESRSEGQVVLERRGARLTMAADGRSRYRQFELVSRASYRDGQEIFLSYVASAAAGSLNEFTGWVGDTPSPVVRANAYANSPAGTPHRFLLWGVIPFGARTRLAPVVEYRTGMPFSPLDALQQYAAEPNSRRFPNFFSLDFRIARDIHVRNHAVQVSFSMFNTTNHWNPDSVRLNVADPQYGQFLGQHRRRYRLDFDFLF
jgi:hypothetical protein